MGGVAETTAMVTPFNSDREFYRWAEENVHPGWTVMYRVWDHANNHLSTPTPNNTAGDVYNAIDWPAAPPSPPVPHSRILLIEKKAKKYVENTAVQRPIAQVPSSSGGLPTR